MRRSLPAFSFALLLVLSACADVGEGPRATVESAEPATENSAFTGTPLAIDTAQSRIDWQAAKVTRTHDGGFEDFNGMVYLDGESLTGVDLTIDAASIWSDSERLTGHLKSDDFFEVETYSDASFRADAFEPINEADTTDWAGATHRITGVLTMHGQSNQVTFPAKVTIADGTVRANANFIIDRQQWGLTYPGAPDDLIQDEVRIKLDIVTESAGAVAEVVPPTES